MSKTPVSILQEFVVSKKIAGPDYQIHGTGASHCMTFTCSVRAGEQTASGVGNTKKEAKHNAAKNLLGLLGVENVETEVVLTKSKVAQIPGINYVGKLNEYCSINRKPLPTYTENHLDLQAQFCIVCTLTEFTTKGYGITKKEAKQDSARQMLELIRENKGYVLEIEEKTNEKIEMKKEVDERASVPKDNLDTERKCEEGDEESNNVDISSWDELIKLFEEKNLEYELLTIQKEPLIRSLKIDKLLLMHTGKTEEDVQQKFVQNVLELINNGVDFSKPQPDLQSS